MISEFNHEHTGWALFSDDRTMRYRLARSLTDTPLEVDDIHLVHARRCVTFVMLNPSTADAFRLDPTITRCYRFAQALGADVLQVVNLFALRSTAPRKLYELEEGNRGDHPDNDWEIVFACRNACRVIAAWGNHGLLDLRWRWVCRALSREQIPLFHLGLNNTMQPRHPLYTKASTTPLPWVPQGDRELGERFAALHGAMGAGPLRA